MDVLSWNVQGAVPPMGSKERIRDQIDCIESVADVPEILLLNEVTTAQRSFWHYLLYSLGYDEIIDTLDWAEELGESTVPPHQDFNHVNGNLIAVHESIPGKTLTRKQPSINTGHWYRSAEKDWETNFPEKILNATVQVGDRSIELWNVRAVPGSMYGEEKIKILENTYNRIRKSEPAHCILGGDFNAPKNELADGTIIPWRSDQTGERATRWGQAEVNLLRGLETVGMVDIFRELHGYDTRNVLDVSHATQTDDPLAVSPDVVAGKRFDHIIASASLEPVDCAYLHEGFACSDHAPLLASFDL